jgi:hypothetical protein
VWIVFNKTEMSKGLATKSYWHTSSALLSIFIRTAGTTFEAVFSKSVIGAMSLL